MCNTLRNGIINKLINVMNILIEIGHPAHVHFFKRTIDRLQLKGANITIVSRNKDITNQLLKKLNIPFFSLSTPPKKRIFLGFELLFRWLAVFKIMLTHRIHFAISISGISTSLPAWLLRIPNFVFTDTEDATLTNKVAFPFANKVFTPNFFLKDLGQKQVRYSGVHETAYLKNFNFEKAKQQREKYSLPPQYCLIRLVANKALHDIGIKGVSDEEVRKMIQKLKKIGPTFITSERELPPDLKPLELKTPIEDIHAVLSGASLFLGESPTMAVESSLLGVPAILISTRSSHLGNMIGLEKENLLINVARWDEAQNLVESKDWVAEKRQWEARAATYVRNTTSIEDFIEAQMGT